MSTEYRGRSGKTYSSSSRNPVRRHAPHSARQLQSTESGPRRDIKPVLPFLDKIPGFHVVFLFDEPEQMLTEISLEVKQRIIDSSALAPVVDPDFYDVIQDFPFPDFLEGKTGTDPKSRLSSLIQPPRGFFTARPDETATGFKERVLDACTKSSQFRRFWRRHTNTSSIHLY